MCSFIFLKFMMVFINFFIFMGGLTLLSMGVWVSSDGGSLIHILGPFSNQGSQVVNVGFFCIVIGAVLVMLGILGCCAAHKKSKCLLLIFSSILLIIFISEVAAGVVALAYTSFAEGILRAWATPALQNQYGNDPVVTAFWNSTMTELKCCGFDNYTDFMGSNFQNQTEGLPSICCRNNSTCTPAQAVQSNVQGCFQQILMIVKKNASSMGGTAAGIGLLEIAAIMVSINLYCHLDNEDS